MLVVGNKEELRQEVVQRRARAEERKRAALREDRKGVSKQQREREAEVIQSEVNTWAEVLQLLDALDRAPVVPVPSNEAVLKIKELPSAARAELRAALRVRLEAAQKAYAERPTADNFRQQEQASLAYQHATSNIQTREVTELFRSAKSGS